MLSDPRSISFVLECIHPPMRHDAQALRRLYARTVDDARLSYSNFNTHPAGAQMTAVHGPASIPNATSHSVLAVTHDRIQIKEEWPSHDIDAFADRCRAAFELSVAELAIPSLVAVQSMVRCLTSAQGVEDCREWLNASFVGITREDTETLGKEPGLFGLRLAFPATEEDPGLHNVRIESFGADNRSIFLENAAVHAGQRPTGEWEPIERVIKGSYDFLTGPVMNWLASTEE